MKMVGAALLVTACSGCGIQVSCQMDQRIYDLREMRRIVSALRQEISYAGTCLPEAFRRIGARTEDSFQRFLYELADEMGQFPGTIFREIFSEKVDEILIHTSLEPVDLAEFKELGNYLGYLDKGMQLSNLDLYLGELDEKILRLGEEFPVRKKLFRAMGVLAGIFLAILFF